MTEERRRATIRLELTRRQKNRIRQATGREVNTLELRLAPLPRPAEPTGGEQSARGR